MKLNILKFLQSEQTCFEIHWERCFICQNEASKDALICPANGTTQKERTDKVMDKVILDNLQKYKEIDSLPKKLNLLLGSENLYENLVANEAVYHKRCKNKFDNYHFERASKRRKTSKATREHGTRSKYQANNFNKKCFFCDREDKETNLSKVMTFVQNSFLMIDY